MTIQSAPYYWVTCDYPECGVSAQEYSDFTAMSDSGSACEAAQDADWLFVEGEGENEKHYCRDHSTYDDEGERIPLPASTPTPEGPDHE